MESTVVPYQTEFNDIPNEIAAMFCLYLRDSDVVSLTSTCSRWYSLRNDVTFHKKVKLTQIMDLWYFDRFTNVVASGEDLKILKHRNSSKSNIKNQRKPKHSSEPPEESPLPEHLVELELRDFKGYLRTWTRGLKHLKRLRILKGCKITVKPGCLPAGLTHLTWETGQDLVRGVLPEGLLVLKVDNYRSRRMALPSTLKSLHIGRNFNVEPRFEHIYPGMLPDGLEVLHIDSKVEFEVDDLPPSLTKIVFGRYYNAWRTTRDLPERIQCVWIQKYRGSSHWA
jgi:hypothetical protein